MNFIYRNCLKIDITIITVKVSKKARINAAMPS